MSRALDIPGDLPGPSDLVVRSSVLRRVVRNPLGVLALVVLAIIVLAAVFGPIVAPFDENFANIDRMLASAGGEHLLGTDSAGRDVWSRLLFGAQITLLSALLCAAVAIAIGLPTGLVAGYYGGVVRLRAQLGREPADEPARHHRAALGARGVRPVRVGHDDRVRGPDQPGILPADPYRGAVGAERAVRRRRPRRGPERRTDHRPTHHVRRAGAAHHPDGDRRRGGDRRAVGPGVPRARRPPAGDVGRDAERRVPRTSTSRRACWCGPHSRSG